MEEKVKRILEKVHGPDGWYGPEWRFVDDIQQALDWLVGCEIVYAETCDYNGGTCSAIILIVRKEQHYRIVVFDSFHEDEDPEDWKYSAIYAKYADYEQEDL